MDLDRARRSSSPRRAGAACLGDKRLRTNSNRHRQREACSADLGRTSRSSNKTNSSKLPGRACSEEEEGCLELSPLRLPLAQQERADQVDCLEGSVRRRQPSSPLRARHRFSADNLPLNPLQAPRRFSVSLRRKPSSLSSNCRQDRAFSARSQRAPLSPAAISSVTSSRRLRSQRTNRSRARRGSRMCRRTYRAR